MHKLAIVYAAAQRNELIITKEDLVACDNLVGQLEDSMKVVFDSIGVSETNKWVKEITSFLRTYGEMPQHRLYRHVMTSMTVKQFDDTCAGMVKANTLRVIQRGPDLMYGLKKSNDEPIGPEHPPPQSQETDG